MSALAGSAAGNLRPGGRVAPKCLRKYFFKMNCLYLSPALETKGLHSLGRLLQSTHNKPDLLTGGALGAVAWEIITREGQERFLDALNVLSLILFDDGVGIHILAFFRSASADVHDSRTRH
jgi:hypothetical protein